jgi:hypothetical protein
VLVLAFALFISVANASAQDEAAADPAQQGMGASAEVVEVVQPTPTPAPAPAPEPAPVVETAAPAPQPEPALTAQPAAEQVAPAPEEQVASIEEAGPATIAARPQEQTAAAPSPITYCHANGAGGWEAGHGSTGGHSSHTSDVIPTSKNWGNFVRSGKVYNGAALFAGGCAASAGFVADVGDIVNGPVSWCNDTGTNVWQSRSASTGPISANQDDIVPAYSYYSGTGALVPVGGRKLTTTFSKDGVTRNGQQILDNGCRIPDPVDVCSNLSGNQETVPAGLVQSGTKCLGEARGCNVSLAFPFFNVVAISSFSGTQDEFSAGVSDIVDWTTAKRTSGFGVVDAVDQNLSEEYYRFTGVGLQTQTLTGAQLLANGCSFTPPAPADVCANIAGNQPTVPAGRIQVGGNCVPPAVSCQSDQTPADNGSTPDSVAGDGVDDACADNPDASCQYADQHPEDRSGGPSKETCVDNPDITCQLVDQHPESLSGGPSKESCVDDPDVTCQLTDQHPENLVGGASKESCVDNPNATCLFDEEAYDNGGSPTSLESCRGIPVTCTTGVPVDTNANGNPDLCAVVVPSLSCKVTADDGSSTLHWVYATNSSVEYDDFSSLLIGGGAGELAPTRFGASGTWTSTLNAGTGNSAWLVDGAMVVGTHSSTPCFEDTCTNPEFEPGDQETIPSGFVRSGIAGYCVPAPPTCAFDERAVDNGKPAGTGRYADDGVADRCRVKKDVTCDFDETPTDTNGNGGLDTCVPKPDVTSCQADERATDTNGNGSKDTCVPKPDVRCGLAIGVDTNGNGSKDACVKITPIIDCGVYNADGTRTLFWRWRNSSPYTVTAPVGAQNVFFDANQPTVFAPGEGSFTSTLNGPGFLGLNSQAWFVTGNTAVGFWNSSITPRCFPDTCPNVAGDQPGVPAGLAINNAGDCVQETTSCDAEYVLADSDSDGVNDGCVADPITTEQCEGRAPFDTNGNGIADACASVQPKVSCVTALEQSGWKAWFTWTSANQATVEVPTGPLNALTGGTGDLPTTFASGEGTPFAVTADADATSIAWKLTDATATATLDGEHCFGDACPNLTGDQQGVPQGTLINDAGACVPAPPTCAEGQVASDQDRDGVNDTCSAKAAAPGSSDAPTDTGSQGDGSAAPTGTGDGSSSAPDDAGVDAGGDDEDTAGESAAPSDSETEGVSAATTTVEYGSGLPYTGLAIGLLLTLGLGFLLTGILARRSGRRDAKAQRSAATGS